MVRSAHHPRESAPPKNFESALNELEALVQTMEAGNLALEESLAAYQRGMELLKYCQTTLDAAQQRIQVLEAGAVTEFPAPAQED